MKRINKLEFDAHEAYWQTYLRGFYVMLRILKEQERYEQFEICEVIKKGLDLFNTREGTNFSTSTDDGN